MDIDPRSMSQKYFMGRRGQSGLQETETYSRAICVNFADCGSGVSLKAKGENLFDSRLPELSQSVATAS